MARVHEELGAELLFSQSYHDPNVELDLTKNRQNQDDESLIETIVYEHSLKSDNNLDPEKNNAKEMAQQEIEDEYHMLQYSLPQVQYSQNDR